MLFDISLIIPWLRIINVNRWLDLPDWVNILDLSQNDLSTPFFVLEHWAEEVSPRWPVVEDWGFVKLVLEHWNALEIVFVYISQERKFLVWLLQYLEAKWTHVLDFGVVRTLWELVRWERSFTIEVSPKLSNHSKIVDKNWILVNMLKEAKLTIFQAQLDPILKILISVDNASLFVLPCYGIPIYDLYRNLHSLLRQGFCPNLDLPILPYGDMRLVLERSCFIPEPI